MTNDDALYLRHILECLNRIDAYVSGGREGFLSDTKTQDAVLRVLQVMAESTQRLSEERKREALSVDWRGIAGFRNILVHAYLGISPERVWEIVQHEIPALRRAIEAMRDS